MSSLGEELPKEMARVRDKVMPQYIQIGAPGQLALMVMRHELDVATKAIMEGDVVAMMRAYEALKGYES